MNRKPVIASLLAVTTGLTLAACSQDGPRPPGPASGGETAAKPQDQGKAAGRPQSPPSPPLDLPEPPTPSPMSSGKDLREAPPDILESAANQLYHQNRYPEAIQILYYAVQSGAHGQYNLACDYALDGKTDAAFYWLQKGALDEGVDAEWAEQDSDLDILRKDRRWSKVASFLKACNSYWENSGHRTTALVVPRGYQPGTPIDVVVGMHGLASEPGRFVSAETYQEVADKLNVAFVGVSGTLPRGKGSFVWSEDPPRDASHIRLALSDLKDKLTPATGRLVTMGFSQGAQMAFEVAFANPSEYLGAIVLSPGTSKNVTLSDLKPDSSNTKQHYVCTCGAGELPGNVHITRLDAEFARKAGSKVELKLYPGVTTHAFPSDFLDVFPTWLKFIRGDDTALHAQKAQSRPETPIGRRQKPRARAGNQGS
jgi:predicted esterase